VNARHNVHATGIVLGRIGLILRGPSGAGKSLLALALLEQWEARGRVARLVADDRIELEATPRGLVMHTPPAIAGMIELRGRGIVNRPFTRRAALHLVVDLVDRLDRMIEEEELVTELCGRPVARCPVPRHGVGALAHQCLLVGEAIRALSPGRAGVGQKTT